MPAVPSHALLALNALLDELDALRADAARVAGLAPDPGPDALAARDEALERLAAADRMDLFEAATQALAAACARREIPRPARAAAYSALVGLIASDLLPQSTFRALYDTWEEALGGRGIAPVVMHGEEVLFHIE